jgi:predicted AAA+ superfamily ATPase
MYNRNITDRFLESLEDSPVILINGGRQTGKSTLVKKVLEASHTYYTLDDFSIQSLMNDDPISFLKAQSTSVIIDEVQKCPKIFQAIKKIVDEQRVQGQFVLTGSANILRLPQLSESLAGRVEIHTLWPLSQREINNKKGSFIDDVFNDNLSLNKKLPDIQALLPEILKGGYPDVIRRATISRRNSWCASYIQTLLQKDVRDIAQIERLPLLPNLLHMLATRIGNLLNVSELSRSCGIPVTTLKRYLMLLESLYLYVPLLPWFNNRSKRLVKSAKVYINDIALLVYALNISGKAINNDPNLLGHIVENFVVLELFKQQTWTNIPVNIYHYRTQEGYEIDIVIESFQSDIIAIEVKSSQKIDKKHIAGIKRFQETYKKRLVKGIILYGGDTCIEVDKNVIALPISTLWMS